MCGICGNVSWNHGPSDTERLNLIKRMTSELTHRGPDDENTWSSTDNTCIFGHSRLIVVDPKGGIQPMTLTDCDGYDYTLVYNGELYNTEELRVELSKVGHVFNSYSDTEVLLRSFMTWKEKCLDRLVGIYAFAIWYKEELFLARDHLGVKPLFFASLKEKESLKEFVFASEMSTLLCHPEIHSEVLSSKLETMMALMIVRMPGNVPFKNVEELMPGHFAQVGSLEESAKEVQNLIQAAVSSQIISDVPFGTLLSGGIDSTTSSSTRRTNDEVYAQLVAEKYATQHHWITNKCENMASLTEEVTEAKCHPIFGDFDTSLFLMFKKIKEKGEATMLLSGEGSDEVFGGYHHIHWDKLVVPGGGLSAFYQTLLKQEWMEKLDLVGAVRKYYERIVASCPTIDGEVEGDIEYRRRIYFHIKAFMPALLERKDLLSMASSLEVRAPFTDHRLVQYVFSLPKLYNYNNGVEMYILRKAMEREADFPREILEREKVPFPVSIDPKTQSEGEALMLRLLESKEDEPIFQIFDKTKVAIAFESGFRSELLPTMMPVNGVHTNLYSFNYWLKKYKVNIIV